MNELQGPQFGIRKAQGDHGVDLEALRGKLEKLHSVPQLKAGLNGKLSRVVVPEVKEATPEQQHEMGVKALAQCVAVAEGEWLAKTMRKIFRDDQIGFSFNRRLNEMKAGNTEPMRRLLSECQIEYGLENPPEGYEMPEGCILVRYLVVKKAGVVRASNIWEWSRQ